MESVKKWLSERNVKKNGMYVHYSPPKLVGLVTAAQLRQLARAGAESRLERAVLAGQGHRLLAEADSLSLSHHLPALIAKCEALHAAVEKGSLLELQEILEKDYNRKKYVNCRDEAGVGLLHKAIFYDYMDIAEYLVHNYPQLVHAKDSEGRTPLHYVAVCRDEAGAAGLLEAAGAARGARDAAGRTPAHYRGHARTLLALPPPRHHDDMARENRNPPGLVIKRHNIRIWCHDCDMARLQRVVWEGHGSRLLSEVSSQPVVRKFLEAVPYIMNTIRDIHQAVIDNDLEGLMKHAGDPVPPQALSCRDGHNMTPMHKAAGLGHSSIMKYIAERYPQGVNDIDNDGRTPLHYAAAVKDEQHTFNTLIDLGADESILDNKNKTPAYYINRPQDIDKNLFKALPDAPRTPSSAYPTSWDWKLLDNYVIAELNKKSKKRNFKASNENISNISSKNYTNTISESTDNRNGFMKTSSTHEFIKDLPELDDSNKLSEQKDEETENQINEVHTETDNIEETKADENNENQEEPNEEVPNEEYNEINETENNEEEKNVENIESNHDENKNENTEEDKNVSNSDDEELDKTEKESPETGDINTEVSHEDDNDKQIEQEHEEENLENEEEKQENEAENRENEEEKQENEKQKQENEEEKEENEAENIEKPQETEAACEEAPKDNEEEDKNNIEDNNTDKHAADIDAENSTNQNKDHDNDSQVDEIKDDDQEEYSNDEIPNISDEHINGVQNEENTHIENNNLQKRFDSGKDKANNEIHNSSKNEGNDINNDHIEDDDDVQVQGDSQSEYSDFNHKSTADISNTRSANLGSVINGRDTQESLIEGVIDGEAEQDSQDASITQREGSVQGEVLIVDNEIDPEVTELINTANMEMLATLVLNGEGSRLIGRQSGNLELQGFLENVPSYMQKINKVHVAARDGNIKDLQSALDRRKFAIARDPISPNGATPLHIATVFGKTNVMKYLGGRFPETLSAVDFEGRTALHYAAVLPDNGHYYHLLQQLGANSKDLDDNGRSAEDYYKNPLLLPFNQLLTDFGISDEAAQTMFSDKVPNDRVSSRRDLDAVESLDTLDRCYRLLASARSTRTPLSASSNRGVPPLVLGRFLKKTVYESIKHRITKLDHDLFDVIWPAVKKLPDNRNIIQTVEEDFPGGVTAPDYYVYEVFQEFLTPLIKDLHNVNINSDLPLHPPSDFIKTSALKLSNEPLVELNIDPRDEFVLSGTIECSRNIIGFELPLNLKVGKLETIERVVTALLMHEEFCKFIEQSNPESDQKGGSYYTLNEVLEKPSEVCASLASNGLLIALCDRDEIDDCTRLHGKHWPYGRGVYVSDDKSVAIWINVHDHIRVLVSSSADTPGEIGLPFSKLSFIMTYLQEKLQFVWHEKLGHLSSRPTFLGSGVRLSLIVNFPGLSKDADNMKHLCAMRGLQYRETLSTGIARISNYQCLGLTETSCFNDFVTASSNLLHLEKDLSMQNSAHIATMLTNIFRRKRSSIADLENSEV